ncbi:MAG: hypothetical protein IPG60_06945 [Bacteroidetes bacterium]|nr:hypothetical protein [Bacteroidota bacterium]MBP7400557.1 hypothetical protein [Chitinophagales bacterium]MBK7110515.1 hypothetical protein [Bacteroidota bacterium]MBK8488257.1 hypothetical protein [Bacteroidota bacterium]MBK8681981.1 hypothetical protein [Bacteroidota bacterium]
MKIKVLLFTAVIGATVLVSCGEKGLSAETKTKMTAFETDWKATGEALKGWEATMNTTLTDMHGMMEKAMPMDGGDVKADKKAVVNPKMDSLNTVCTNIFAKADELKATYSNTLTSWNADEKAYADWKANNKNIPEEEVVAGIDEYNTKLASYKAQMDGWNTTLMALQADCKNTCDMMTAHMAM